MKEYLREKRDELIWALSMQDYMQIDIAQMFNIDKATVLRIIQKKPAAWRPKWKKALD